MSDAFKCDRCGTLRSGEPHRHAVIRWREDESSMNTDHRDYCHNCWLIIEDVASGKKTRGDTL